MVVLSHVPILRIRNTHFSLSGHKISNSSLKYPVSGHLYGPSSSGDIIYLPLRDLQVVTGHTVYLWLPSYYSRYCSRYESRDGQCSRAKGGRPRRRRADHYCSLAHALFSVDVFFSNYYLPCESRISPPFLITCLPPCHFCRLASTYGWICLNIAPNEIWYQVVYCAQLYD